MSPTIRISPDTYERLKAHAEPFVDTPDSVIRRLLGVDDSPPHPAVADDRDGERAGARGATQPPEAPVARAPGSNGADLPRARRTVEARNAKSRGRDRVGRTSGRAPRGSLLADDAYELPILQVLSERGGRAAKNEVLDALEQILGERLTDLDRAPLNSGEIRWRNRAQFARLRLVQRGDMATGSPRGVWELADPGRERIREAEMAGR
jgi:hypothetical protein